MTRKILAIIAALALVLAAAVPALAGANEEHASCIGRLKSNLGMEGRHSINEIVRHAAQEHGLPPGQVIASVTAKLEDCPW